MRFSKALRDIGDEFRRKFLDSTDEEDKTVLEDDWTKMKVSPTVCVCVLMYTIDFAEQTHTAA